MGERIMHFSDLSGQMIENPEEIVGVVVTEHPDLDGPVRLEAMPQELVQLGKLSIAGVGLEVTSPDDEEPTRYLLTVSNFNKLATGRPMAEVLENAEPFVPPKAQRRSRAAGLTNDAPTTRGPTADRSSTTTIPRTRACRTRGRSAKPRQRSCETTWSWSTSGGLLLVTAP